MPRACSAPFHNAIRKNCLGDNVVPTSPASPSTVTLLCLAETPGNILRQVLQASNTEVSGSLLLQRVVAKSQCCIMGINVAMPSRATISRDAPQIFVAASHHYLPDSWKGRSRAIEHNFVHLNPYRVPGFVSAQITHACWWRRQLQVSCRDMRHPSKPPHSLEGQQ